MIPLDVRYVVPYFIQSEFLLGNLTCFSRILKIKILIQRTCSQKH